MKRFLVCVSLSVCLIATVMSVALACDPVRPGGRYVIPAAVKPAPRPITPAPPAPSNNLSNLGNGNNQANWDLPTAEKALIRRAAQGPTKTNVVVRTNPR